MLECFHFCGVGAPETKPLVVAEWDEVMALASADVARRLITAFICWKRTAHTFALPSRSTAWLDRISWPLLAAPTHAVLIQSVTLLICNLSR